MKIVEILEEEFARAKAAGELLEKERGPGKPRIEHLRSSSAAIKFLSVEPLLEDLGDLCLKGILDRVSTESTDDNPDLQGRGVSGHPYEQGFDLRLIPEKLAEPFGWSRSSMVSVNSMSDLFHPDVPDYYIHSVVNIMLRAKWHTYQVLTKRSERLQNMLNGPLRLAASSGHIW